MLTGNSGNNILTGGNVADTLICGAGSDSMSGGLGADTFDFNAISESLVGVNRDVITDFSSAQGDKIDLSGIDANTTVANDQLFSSTIITSGAFTEAGQRRLVGKMFGW